MFHIIDIYTFLKLSPDFIVVLQLM